MFSMIFEGDLKCAFLRKTLGVFPLTCLMHNYRSQTKNNRNGEKLL